MFLNSISCKYSGAINHVSSIFKWQLLKSRGNLYCRRAVPLFNTALSSRAYGIRVRAFHSVAVSVGRQLDSFRVYGASGSKTYVTVVKKSEVEMPEVKPFERLPSTVQPEHYKLVLIPDLKTFTFKGEVSIQIKVFLTYVYKLLLHLILCFLIYIIMFLVAWV